MTTTTVVLSWLLVAQTGQTNPFSQRDPDAAPPRKTLPAATMQDEHDIPPAATTKAPSRWADESPSTTPKPNLQREAPAAEPTTNPFRRETPAAPAAEAPAWGGAKSASPGNRWQTQDDTAERPAAVRPRATEPDPRATAEPPARASWGNTPERAPAATGNSAHLEGGLLLPLSKPKPNSVGSELITQGLVPPRAVTLPGRPLTLLEAISRGGDRQQQLRTARAYWRLAVAQVDYYWTIDESQMFEQLQARKKPHEAQAIKAAQASATARVHEAELAVRSAQSDLAELIRPASFETLPLVSDSPFVGTYKTYFEQLFSDRAAPGRTRSIDQNLPVRRDLVEARAKAVLACNEVADALAEGYRKNECDTTDLIAAAAELRRERHDFLAAVRDYNYDIAEYATSVATGNTSHQTLVSMMIRVNRPAVQSATQPNRNPNLNRAEPAAPASIRRSSFEDEPRNTIEFATPPAEPRQLPTLEQPARDLRMLEPNDHTQSDPGTTADGKRLFSVMVKPNAEPVGPNAVERAQPAALEIGAAPTAERFNPIRSAAAPNLTEPAQPAAEMKETARITPSARLTPVTPGDTGRADLPEAPPFRPRGN